MATHGLNVMWWAGWRLRDLPGLVRHSCGNISTGYEGVTLRLPLVPAPFPLYTAPLFRFPDLMSLAVATPQPSTIMFLP